MRRARQRSIKEQGRDERRKNFYLNQNTTNLKLKRQYLSQYGFCADHSKPVWFNVQEYISKLPAHYLFAYNNKAKGCHNLLTPNSLYPRAIPSLLHLGLKFIPHLPTTTNYFRHSAERFKRDVRRISTFYGKPPQEDRNFIPQLYFKNDAWDPDLCENKEVERAMKRFLTSIHRERRRYSKPILSNIFPHHWRLIRHLKNHDQYIVVEADKNLGGCILNRDVYISRAIQDHLGDSNVYRRISQEEAYDHQKSLGIELKNLFTNWEDNGLISEAEGTYLLEALDRYEDKPTRFRLSIKVHKSPWATRPIVCCAGTALNSVSRWVDYWLQQIKSLIPTYIKNSAELINDIRALGPLPLGARLFKADAKSMYTNISTDHGIATVNSWLDDVKDQLPDGFPLEPLKQALEIVMRNNVFEFGDTRYLQLMGTAMGTSTACMYATVYYAMHEMQTLLPSFQPNLIFLRRYIDDIFGIWCCLDGSITWPNFTSAINNFGILRWDISEPTTSLDYLDIELTLKQGSIFTKTFQKEMNLYQYLPPHSAHPPSMQRGIIYSLMRSYFYQNTLRSDYESTVITLYKHLLARGWNKDILKKYILESNSKLHSVPPSTGQTQTNDTTDKPTTKDRLFFHIPYHPNDIPRRRIQQLYQLHCHDAFQTIGINSLTVAYSRHRNLREQLTQARLHQAPGRAASHFYNLHAQSQNP